MSHEAPILLETTMPRITTSSPQGLSRFNKGLRRFREANPRIDYYPSEGAREAIERLRRRYPDHPMRDLIDALIREGDKAFSGNKPRHG